MEKNFSVYTEQINQQRFDIKAENEHEARDIVRRKWKQEFGCNIISVEER